MSEFDVSHGTSLRVASDLFPLSVLSYSGLGVVSVGVDLGGTKTVLGLGRDWSLQPSPGVILKDQCYDCLGALVLY